MQVFFPQSYTKSCLISLRHAHAAIHRDSRCVIPKETNLQNLLKFAEFIEISKNSSKKHVELK